MDSATSWSDLMSDRNGVGTIVIDYQRRRLGKEGATMSWFSCGIASAYGYISIRLVRRARLPARQHARAAPGEVMLA